MKRALTAAAALLILAACSSGATGASAAREAALQRMNADGVGDGQITDVVAGDPTTMQGADELYCVATDVTTQNGELPYLLMVWRTGSQWQAKPLAEGYYEWDLQGCPR